MEEGRGEGRRKAGVRGGGRQGWGVEEGRGGGGGRQG